MDVLSSTAVPLHEDCRYGATDVMLPQESVFAGDCLEVILRHLRLMQVHGIRTVNTEWYAASRARQGRALALTHSSFARFARRYRVIEVRRAAYGQCANCGLVGSYHFELPRCSGCESVYYCGDECQQADSRMHGWRCRQMQGIWF